MVNIVKSCCVLFVLAFPFLVSAFVTSGRSRLAKRFMGRSRGGRRGVFVPGERKLFMKSRGFQTVTVARRHQSIFLECEAGGSPPPTIHWLKDGERLSQGDYESYDDDSAMFETQADGEGADKLRLSGTKSRLYLDCPTRRDEGEYTCVAETPYMRRTQSTVVKVEGHRYAPDASCMTKRSSRGEPARVYMWTVSRLEYEDSTVQLFCRASGVPEPTITWYDSYNNTLPTSVDDQFSIADNGDLLIRDISWFNNMGMYRCVAENQYGSHSVETFLYPAAREESFDLPV